MALKKRRLWKEKIKEIKDIVARARLEGHEGFFHLPLDCVGFCIDSYLERQSFLFSGGF